MRGETAGTPLLTQHCRSRALNWRGRGLVPGLLCAPFTLLCLLLNAWWLTTSVLHLAPYPPVPLNGEAASHLAAAWLYGLLY